VSAGFLAGVDQLPELVDGQGHRDFDKGVLAGVHGVDTLRAVPAPGRGDEHGVNVVVLKQTLVVVFAGGVEFGRIAAGVGAELAGLVGGGCVRVGDGDDPDVFEPDEFVQVL